jgi:ribosomal protein S3
MLFKKSIEKCYNKNKNSKSKYKVKGLQFQVKGRVSGSDRKKKTAISFGNMPKQSIFKNIDYALQHVNTPFGVCSVKLWVYWDNLLY